MEKTILVEEGSSI